MSRLCWGLAGLLVALVIPVALVAALTAVGVSRSAATVASEVAIAVEVLFAFVVWRVRVGRRREALLRKLADR